MARAAETLAGPVRAEVVRVIDGDTVEVDAEPWPGMTVRTAVRLRGIDAPEMAGKCATERVFARAARILVEAVVTGVGPRVVLTDIAPGKYAGRVIADVFVADGRSLAAMVIASHLARPYDGGKREGWCEGQESGIGGPPSRSPLRRAKEGQGSDG